MKNKSVDLNNHLFAQLERLNDEDIKGEALRDEIARSKASASIAKNIIDNARLQLDAQRLHNANEISAAPEFVAIEQK